MFPEQSTHRKILDQFCGCFPIISYNLKWLQMWKKGSSYNAFYWYHLILQSHPNWSTKSMKSLLLCKWSVVINTTETASHIFEEKRISGYWCVTSLRYHCIKCLKLESRAANHMLNYFRKLLESNLDRIALHRHQKQLVWRDLRNWGNAQTKWAL